VDWARAIERNRDALNAILLGLFAMVGLTADGALARLPKPLCNAALRILRPAESAVRRLIVIAARGIVVKPQAVRPMPKGLAIAGKGLACMFAARAAGERWREAAAIGTLMNARGLMELVILNIGLQAGIIRPTLFTIMVLMAVITTLMTSPLFHWLYQRHQDADAPEVVR